MDYKTYVQTVVAAYAGKQDKNIVFIKHYNTLDISEEEILAHVDDRRDDFFLYHNFDMHVMHDAYEPFLDWIRRCYERYYKDSMSAEDFLSRCGVYPMHIEPLSGYITNGICTRREDVFSFEIIFENEKMLTNLVGILDYISKEHHLVMILSKFHLAPFSTVELFRKIMNSHLNIHAIIMYNDEFIIARYKKQIWDKMIQLADDKNLQLDWGSLDSERSIDVQDKFWFEKTKAEEYVNKLRNMYHTFALDDAYYYLTDILYRIDDKTIWLTKEEQIPFLQIAALVNMNLKNINQALVICDKMTDLCKNLTDPQIAYMFNYTCARARMINSEIKFVETYCRKCIDIAKEMGDEFLVCKAEVLLWSAYCGISKNIFEYDFAFKVTMEMVERTKKFGFTNFLAYMYVFGFENDDDSVNAIASGEKEPYYFNLGIEIGTKLENDNFLLNAYMKNIMLYSRMGHHNYVREMYKKRLAVLKRPNPLREAHMLAGLGYNSIILEDYEKAYSYLITSVANLTELESPDDVMNSLYNLAMNYFVAESYQETIDTVDLILKMLKELGYQSIGASSTTKLYSLIAISCYYQEEYYNCYYYLSKIDVIVEHMLGILEESEKGIWEEDLLLSHLVKATLYNYEGRFDLCLNELESVKHYMSIASGSVFFAYPVYAIELATLYRKRNMNTEADAVLNEAIAYCDKENMPRKKEKLVYFKENNKRLITEPIGKKSDLPIAKILQITRQAGTQNRLDKREKDIRFLTVLQEAISRENLTTDDLFQNTSAVLKNSYNIDDIMIIRRKDGKSFVMHEGDEPPLSEEQIETVFDFFKDYKQAFLTNRVDKNFTQFRPLMEPFDEKHIMTMIAIPIIERSGTATIFLGYIRIKRRSVGSRALLGEDDLMILKFAFSQFCEMMRRIDNRLIIDRMNRELEQSAITDHLTGITNRNGFSKQIDLLAAQDGSRTNVILYLDLDNFKYYNDTFGHEIGDLVLVCFAEMFKRMTNGKGVAVRYGGDEFIILLYDQNEADGAYLAEQIYEEISDGFREQIAIKLNKEINIPDEKKISCSIGIASFKGGSKDAFEQALNHADQMLYYVKRHGKSKYKMFGNG